MRVTGCALLAPAWDSVGFLDRINRIDRIFICPECSARRYTHGAMIGKPLKFFPFLDRLNMIPQDWQVFNRSPIVYMPYPVNPVLILFCPFFGLSLMLAAGRRLPPE
jgi:hypothetical protein